MSMVKFKAVYDEEFVIDRGSGKGFDRVVSKMEPTFTKNIKETIYIGL